MTLSEQIAQRARYHQQQADNCDILRSRDPNYRDHWQQRMEEHRRLARVMGA